MTMITCHSFALAIGVVALVTRPVPVQAQSVSPEGDTIRRLVRVGQKVTITDSDGEEYRGRIDTMTTEGLEMRGNHDKAAMVRYERIVRINHPDDTLANGAWIGLGIGGGFGVLSLAATVPMGATNSDIAVGGLLFGGVGAAIGVGVDALIHGKHEIYRRAPGARATIVPVLGRGVRGGAVSYSW
jgi:hypothetical protein